MNRLNPSWSGPGGSREVLLISYPLILGYIFFTIQTFVDRLFLTWYSPEAGADPIAFVHIQDIAIVLLRFVALYSIFDTMNIIFSSGLRGAGDTMYPLALSTVLSWATLLVPVYIACVQLGGGVYIAWSPASAYIIFLGLFMMRRFRKGHWKALRVIEPNVLDLDEEP